jgi:hypothetical protein
MDPTNNRQVDDHFIKVAMGRDFTDVPNKGIYRGPGVIGVWVRANWTACRPCRCWRAAAFGAAHRHSQVIAPFELTVPKSFAAGPAAKSLFSLDVAAAVD